MLAHEFKQLLKEAGFTQAGLARELSQHGSCSDRTVNRWCNGHTPPPAAAIAYLRLKKACQSKQARGAV